MTGAAAAPAAAPKAPATTPAATTGAGGAPSLPGTGGPVAPTTGTGGMTMLGTGGATAPNAGGTGGTGGAGATPPGTAGMDPVDVKQMGPYKFMKYTDGITDPAYDSAVLYYPVDAPGAPYGAVVFSPGFTATKEQYEMFLGPLLASHGIIIMLTTPTTTGDLPDARAADLQAAIAVVQKENTRDGSPIKGKVDGNRMCITGHSMGGGGTMIAANMLGNKIKCAVPLQPWEPGMTFPMVAAPIMFIAGQSDTVAAPASNALPFYMSVPATVPKYYVEFAGASHFLTTNDLGTAYDVQSKYMVAFYKTYLDGDMRYLDVLNAPMDPAVSSYMKSK
jgi:hypothetical protein